MTAPEPAPAVAWCEHYAPAGECCPQPTAPASEEPSPVERVSDALAPLTKEETE